MADNIKVGITHGDFNGIGYEVILKALDDERIPELFTPVIFGSARVMKYYKDALGMSDLQVRRAESAATAATGAINLVDIGVGECNVQPGQPSQEGGKVALASLQAAVEALKNGEIDVLVTAPIDKSSIHSEEFDFPGHTEWLEHQFAEESPDDHALMILYSDDMRVALVTTHLPIAKVAEAITEDAITQTTTRLDSSLRRDFGIVRPRIAVLGLNPHCGDHGVAGKEDDEIIAPAIAKMRAAGTMAFGPFPADGFFASGLYKKYDGIVAMYHDQGLAPFKALAGAEGVNYTAGLKYVRTSPDHGTGYDIAGQGVADPLSMRHAIYGAIDIFRARRNHDMACSDPLPSDGSSRNEQRLRRQRDDQPE